MSTKKKEEFNILEISKAIDKSINDANKQGRNVATKDIKINAKDYSVKEAISLLQKLKKGGKWWVLVPC